MIMIKLIGLAGKKRTGKNLAAEYIKDILHKKDPHLLTGAIGFADGVKYVAAEALNVDRMTFFDDKNKEKFFRIGADIELTGRQILQRVGTEMFRDELCWDFWIYRLMKVIKGQPDFFFIITDVRFINEVRAIKDAGGVVIRLNRETGLDDSHPTETSLDGLEFEYDIFNNGSKEVLKAALEDIIKELDI